MHHRPSPLIVPCAVALLAGAAGCKESQANASATTSPPPVVAARGPVTPGPAEPPIHAAVAAPTPSPLPSPDAARAIERSCAKICEHSTSLHCAHAEDCTPNCLAMSIGTPCADEFAGLYRCLESEPPAHWECAEDGVAAVREGYCEKQQAAAVGCMEAKAR